MKPTDLRAALARSIRQATGSFSTDISNARSDSFERYMGEPYGDEVKDRSSVVSTDVSDTVEWIMPSLMKIFTSGDKVATFEPQSAGDEQAADQETDAVNYVFYRQNEGWLALYSFIKDGLIMKNGYIKRYWEERDVVRTEEYSGLTTEAMNNMVMDWNEQGWEYEVLREEIGEDGLYSVECKLSRTDKKLVVVPVPPEEMLVSSRWHSVMLDDCPFVAHRRTMVVGDLVEMGYDRKQAESLTGPDDGDELEEKFDRFSVTDATEEEDYEEMDPSTREVLVHECYFRADLNGDGIPELNKATVGGTGYEILKWKEKDKGRLPGFEGLDVEEVEVVPFSAWTPVIVPHRHYGRSIAELIEDLQRIKTVLFRQMLDNIYLANNPTREIVEAGIGESTIADLLNDRPGKIVRTKAPGMYVEHAPKPFMQQMMPAIEYVDGVRETRTGVSRYNQGLDAESLNKTATGIARIMSAGEEKIALIARICAETGLKHLFRGIHGDLRRHGGRQMTMRLRDNWVEIDPQSWRERADMTISVGLGNADRQDRMQYLSLIIQEQKEHLLQGSPMVTMDNLFNSYEKFVEGAGFKSVEAYFTNPEGQQVQQGGGGQGGAEALMAIEQMKSEQRMAEAHMKAQADVQKVQDQEQMDMVRARMEDDRERDKTNMEFALRIAEMNAKNQTAITLEAIRSDAKAAASMNQMGPNV